MAQFTVDIPGLGPVTVDGPFATEDSIRRLSDAIGRSQTTSGRPMDTRSFDRVSHSFHDLNDGVEDAVDEFNRLQRSTRDSGSVFDRLSSGLNKTVASLRGLSAGSGEVKGGFGKMFDLVSGGVNGIAGFIPGVGMLTTAFTGLVGAALGIIEGLEETNIKIMSAGALFKGGIDDFALAASEGGIAMSALTKSITENADSYRMLTGGMIGGTKTIAGAFKKLGNEQQQILYSMGFSSDEILSGMADFAAMAKLSGQDLDMQEVAEGGAAYLKNQRELTRLTGKSIDQLKKEREELRSMAEFQSFLNNISDPKMRAAIEDTLISVPQGMKEFANQLILGSPINDPAMALLQSKMPDVAAKITALGEAARRGTIGPDEFRAEMNSLTASLSDRSQAIIDSFGGPGQVRLIRQSSDLMDQFFRMLEQTNVEARGFEEAFKATNQAMDTINGPKGPLAEALGLFARYDNQISVILQRLGTSLATLFAPGGVFVDIMNSLVAFGDEVSAAFEQWSKGDGTGENSFGALWDKVYESFMKRFGEIFNASTGILKSVFDSLTGAIASGIEKGFDNVLAALGYETDTKEQSDAAAAIAKLPAELQNVIQRPSLSYGEMRSGRLTPEHQAQQEAFDKMWEVDDLAAMGYVQEGSKLLGTETYRRMTEDELKKRDAEKAAANQTVNPVQAPRQALGNVFEPKPGGHIITVAEAMSPELVAPAKRGSDGKLGLEVSGVMLDNSRLLQSLAESSKNQISVMAAVNNKMSEMVSNMEKFARAQEQANRLAV